jgi:prevent-host-death family protein
MCEKKVIPERKINAYKNRFWVFPEKGDYVTVVHEQYVVNENGEKVAIILPIEEYEKMKEDLHDLAIVAERRSEKIISLEEMKRKL